MCFRLLLVENQLNVYCTGNGMYFNQHFLNFIFLSMGELSHSPRVQTVIRNIFIGTQA